MLHMTKTISPPTKPPRVSVPLDLETLAVFQRLANAGNMSTGGAIADWLRETVEAAEFMASKMEQARAAPKVVMREMHAYALAMADETGALMRELAAKGAADRTSKRAQATAKAAAKAAAAVTAPGQPGGGTSAGSAAASHIPPSCNTGGKVPKNTNRPKAGKPS